MRGAGLAGRAPTSAGAGRLARLAFGVLILSGLSATPAMARELTAQEAARLAGQWERACQEAGGDFEDSLACSQRRSTAPGFQGNPVLAQLFGSSACNQLAHRCTNYRRSMTEERRQKAHELGRILSCRPLFSVDVSRACRIDAGPEPACVLDAAAQAQVNASRRLVRAVRIARLDVPGIEAFEHMLRAVAIGMTMGRHFAEQACDVGNFEDAVIGYCTAVTTYDRPASEHAACANFARQYQNRAVRMSMNTAESVGRRILTDVFGFPPHVVNGLR
jgi:hypothetical protein